MASVTLKNVKKIYDGGVVAVKDFNLSIEDKEFVVFVGPSGCGKSTTLRMIAGLEDITEGEVYIGDRLVNNVIPKDRNIAMVFQNYALYPHLTVYENMAFSLSVRHEEKSVIDRKVKEAAEILDITDLLGRKPKALSGGQRQRVAIGRAIVRDPQVFLMDEPLSNLDAKLRNQMRTEILKLRRKLDTTFIYVTHDQTEAMTLGDRIVIMKDGVIQQVGTPQEVFGHPANVFVAGFIGTPQMNFIDGRLEKTGSGYVVRCEDAEIELPKDVCARFEQKGVDSRDVILGIRPEHIKLGGSGKNTMSCALDVSEMMGSEIYMHVKAQSGTECIVRVPIIELPEEYADWNNIQGSVVLSLRGELCHIFDKETQENLDY
ncbi:MAG: sn-glycerol-3-phosphate ABC transporter ATP-binding protein UgpC [Firmicutes bacterium]|nr:sn-glycerol-3-phosphate ABC transporter ATP-binding protein UgpC [Bacillota bacterium]